jgi:metal-responsive CopG/Arc/MetJ family transcriptional regulator
MTKSEFLIELSEIASQIDDLFERYGKREEIISIMLTGTVEESEDGEKHIRAVYGYNIYSEEELDEILSFIKDTYNNPGAGADLGDFDVFLN